MSRPRLPQQARTAVAVVQREQLPFLAAAIAYYAFLSVVPLFVVGFAVATALAGQAVATRVLTAVGDFLTPEASDVLTQMLLEGGGREGITLVGLAVLVWGALRLFRGLDIAFSRIYGTSGSVSLPSQLRNAVLVVAAIGVAIATTVLLGALVPLVGLAGTGFAWAVGVGVVLPLVFFPLYYVLPARDVTVREALPGSVFAAVGWTLLGVLFGIYTTYAGSLQLYGVFGGMILLLVWFYFGGLVLLFGVALNAVVAGRFQDRQLQQGPLRAHSQRATMSEADGPTEEGPETPDDTATTSRAQRERNTVTREELQELRDDLDQFEEEIEHRTVHREELESDLKQYVRSRVRRGHATGWGPYLVLLYGTVMTLGGFYFLGGGWAVLAMLVIWLSTLGLYVLMLLVGVTVTAAGVPGRALDFLRNLR